MNIWRDVFCYITQILRGNLNKCRADKFNWLSLFSYIEIRDFQIESSYWAVWEVKISPLITVIMLPGCKLMVIISLLRGARWHRIFHRSTTLCASSPESQVSTAPFSAGNPRRYSLAVLTASGNSAVSESWLYCSSYPCPTIVALIWHSLGWRSLRSLTAWALDLSR